MTGEYDDNRDALENKIALPPLSEESATTQDIPDHIADMADTIGADNGTLLMMLPGQSTPITFVKTESIILGRFDPATGLYPTVDLTPFFGKTMGVSRRHAEIIFKDKHYFVRDLDSANGTTLNGKTIDRQPQQIRSGDQLRLGELLIVLFLSDKDPSQSSRPSLTGLHSVYVQHTVMTMPPDSITIDFLDEVLLHYLRALNTVQATVIAANKQATQHISLNGMRVIKKLNTVEFQLIIHHPMLIMLRDNIQKLMNQTPQSMDESLLLILYRRSAQAMLEQLTPIRINDDQYDVYLDRLQTDLQNLFTIPLQMVSVDL
ncbi:MAG: FHA domain-containing protein [Anaerolineae bacterium]|nr:FHA domain-containing protein [Anaerolineae bacterium]